ncbi:lectin [Pseudoxanthomonas mexicana]|uniref:lectin n=1 Tax=Pseudoxanthomonas mexicana TaxID=128785 RepID=UPI00398B078A
MRAMLPSAVLLAVVLGGCKPPEPAPQPVTTASMAEPPPAAQQDDAQQDDAQPAPPVAISQASFLGYGDMRLGETVEQARAAWGGELNGLPGQDSSCYYLTPKWVARPADFAFMIEDGRFVRYDVGTDKETAPGGGKVGMSATELQAMYGGALASAPHKYVEGGQYLSIDASGVAPSKLVFEVDAAGIVTAWRVGLLPQADYVEGCS